MTKKVLLVFAMCLMIAMGSSSTSFLRKQTALIPDINDLTTQNNAQVAENTETSAANDTDDTLKLISVPESDQSSSATFLGNTPIINIDDLIARQNETKAINGTDATNSTAEETTEQRGLDTENSAANLTNGTNSTEGSIETPENGEDSNATFLGNTPIVSIDDLSAQQNETNGTNATNGTNNTAEETSEQRGLDAENSENTETSAANNTNDTLQLISVPESDQNSKTTFLGNTPIISIDDLIAQQNGANSTVVTNDTAEEAIEHSEQRALDDSMPEVNNTEAQATETPIVAAVNPIGETENEENSEASEEESNEEAEESSESTQQLLNTTTANNNSTTFLGNTPIISIDDLIKRNSA